MVTDAPADSPAHALNTSVIDILQLLIMMASSLSVCSVDSAALSKVAAQRDGGSAAGRTGTDRLAAGTGPSAWRGTSGTLSVSRKSRRLLPASWVPGILRLVQRRGPTHEYYSNI